MFQLKAGGVEAALSRAMDAARPALVPCQVWRCGRIVWTVPIENEPKTSSEALRHGAFTGIDCAAMGHARLRPSASGAIRMNGIFLGSGGSAGYSLNVSLIPHALQDLLEMAFDVHCFV